jgi:hypothetical protein
MRTQPEPNEHARCACCGDRIDPRNYAHGRGGLFFCLPCFDELSREEVIE